MKRNQHRQRVLSRTPHQPVPQAPLDVEPDEVVGLHPLCAVMATFETPDRGIAAAIRMRDRRATLSGIADEMSVYEIP
jgi:hypothetical protein